QEVEQEDLTEAEGPPPQDLAVQVPGDGADAIEFEDSLHFEFAIGREFAKAPGIVAAVVAENLVERSVVPLSLRDQRDGMPAVREHAADVEQRSAVILYVLDDVQADDGVERLAL